MCVGGVRQDAVSRTTDTLRQTATETAITAHDISAGHRTTVLCASGRQDTHRDSH